ncbi:flagellar filament capping protein FliD [Rhizobacter sp. SG703]|uniref:flagellar filament capping protein FliD n=1 Tax=Rhizobacter sp. SG703 TaxID=2587140 RepID=UPI0014456677|nr:flagellar filament capping protein FliD [Rhizobacter sp. SG703]
MASVTSAGIGSGLDVESIITKLMAVEKLPVTQLQTEATKVQTKISAYGSIQSSVSSFRDAALALTRSGTWGATAATSADTSAVTVSGGSNASAGNYAVSVQKLAAAQSVASTSFASSSAVVGEGSLTIDTGSWDIGEPGFKARATISAMNIAISSTDTLADVRDKINAAGGSVAASIVTDSSGARLVLSSKATGVDNGFRVTASGAGPSAFTYDTTDETAPMKRTQTAADAEATINGLKITSASNTLNDVVQGLTMNLQKVTTADVQVSVAQDNASIKSAITNFTAAYNGLASLLKTQTKYDDATKTAGTLQGDSTAVSLQRQLRTMLTGTGTASSAFPTLSSIGLEMQTDGTLKVSDTKLTSALGNLTEMKKAFANSDTVDSSKDGFAQKLRALGDQVLGTNGSLAARTTGLNSTLKDNQERQDDITDRMTATEKRLRAQYTALDTKMAGLNTLSTYISQQIANWNKSTG